MDVSDQAGHRLKSFVVHRHPATATQNPSAACSNPKTSEKNVYEFDLAPRPSRRVLGGENDQRGPPGEYRSADNRKDRAGYVFKDVHVKLV
ncbi:hypothetical protein DL766_007341 [Monosporascus sp. MC13-8B]|uniref:Uncharacterized protein n=1 Tax=Monosporascus cannonballus TaxID=155416 RepID=A0ABY0H577_9PEZI|nr:hypothetical protein DL762_005328 [Monosporascus cannonballus]RYO99759.1 hypothetical protein DL763_001258 [Monosporascus cannonballus]RYP24132.1 hypothetical protein DL766_007341 [Monosporascus sp. MC13-8B]